MPRRTVAIDQRAMRDVGIVAGVLDDAGRRPPVARFGDGQREGDAVAARQRDLDRIGEIAGQQRRAGGLGRRGGAGAGRPAALAAGDLRSPWWRSIGLRQAARHRRKRRA